MRMQCSTKVFDLAALMQALQSDSRTIGDPNARLHEVEIEADLARMAKAEAVCSCP